MLPPVIASQQEMQDAMTQALESAAAGALSVEEALAQAASKIDSLLG